MIPPGDEPDDADDILDTLHNVCTQLDITYFLYGGTALGFYRDGAYIPLDNDLDIGIISTPEKFLAMKDRMEAEGFTVDGVNHYWKHNILLDIRGGTDFWGPEPVIQRCVVPYTDQFDAVSYKGRAYNIPHPIEEHFACHYGPNWKTPKPKVGHTVFAPVCADPLHIGHVRWLEKAAALGNYLIAGICTDEFMESFKNPPAIPYEQRREIVAALRCVDFAEPLTAFNDYSAIEKHSVSIYIVDDLFPSYEEESLAKTELSEKGITYVTIPRTPNISSTQIKKDCCHNLCHANDCGLRSTWLQCLTRPDKW